MTGPTHLIVGLTVAVATGYNSPAQLAVTSVSSILPDIDRQNSLLGRFIPILPTLIEKTAGKRTITHSLLFGVIMGLLIYLLHSDLLMPFLIGFGTHILLDIPTGNVHLLYPLPINFGLYIGVPPVFWETGTLISLGVLYALKWDFFLSKFTFLPF